MNMNDEKEKQERKPHLASWVSAIADLVGWVEVTKPNIAFISYLNLLGFTSFNPTYILFHTRRLGRNLTFSLYRLSNSHYDF